MLRRIVQRMAKAYRGSAPANAPAIVAPDAVGAPDGVPTAYATAAGLERLEMLAALARDGGGPNDVFLMRPLDVSHYGTPADPILVDSVVGERIVGCTGFPKYSHAPLWMWVRWEERDTPARCAHCGQAFRINKLA